MDVKQIHDAERPTLKDLEGLEIRLHKPGGPHFEGVLRDAAAGEIEWADNPPADGEYEVSFREPGSNAWHNDARLPRLTV